jgi:hypothetical protein
MLVCGDNWSARHSPPRFQQNTQAALWGGTRCASEDRWHEEVERMEAIYANCFLAPVNDTSPLLTELARESRPRARRSCPDVYADFLNSPLTSKA